MFFLLLPLSLSSINLGECETEEEILEAIEQSRKITRLIISAVQKGSKFEVSQILEHYGYTSKLSIRLWSNGYVGLHGHKFVIFVYALLFQKIFKIVLYTCTCSLPCQTTNKIKFSLIGIENEEEIFNVLKKNRFAMEKLKQSVPQGTIAVSDLLTEWELPIGALQSKIIRRVQNHFKEEENEKTKPETNGQKESGNAQPTGDNDEKEQKKVETVIFIFVLF
ncbi:hypothetical protein RFI_27281 [Reticulomyxa filosa]|uniref:Uncharacterized protein n=1 Tax=Reticulomyxa filosa TaxID=46433 RepID=X6M9D9_RETFI|nr:hypothetical protein RFI_27281 [Reticulomyxa filosa]|eukprot:ETO10097.1 hypothetical protein RFI_27281 [Reticulomyxa filosa]